MHIFWTFSDIFLIYEQMYVIKVNTSVHLPRNDCLNNT